MMPSCLMAGSLGRVRLLVHGEKGPSGRPWRVGRELAVQLSGARARSARARRTYDRIMTDRP
jgi:hypothetical protein